MILRAQDQDFPHRRFWTMYTKRNECRFWKELEMMLQGRHTCFYILQGRDNETSMGENEIIFGKQFLTLIKGMSKHLR